MTGLGAFLLKDSNIFLSPSPRSSPFFLFPFKLHSYFKFKLKVMPPFSIYSEQFNLTKIAPEMQKTTLKNKFDKEITQFGLNLYTQGTLCFDM